MVSPGLVVLMASSVLLALTTGILIGYALFADEESGSEPAEVKKASVAPAPAAAPVPDPANGIIDDTPPPPVATAGPLSLEDFAGFGGGDPPPPAVDDEDPEAHALLAASPGLSMVPGPTPEELEVDAADIAAIRAAG